MASYTDLIEQYMSGRLPEKEMKRFEKELETNDLLYEEYSIARVIFDVIETENDIREIESEPGYAEMDRIANELVDDFLRNEELYRKLAEAPEDDAGVDRKDFTPNSQSLLIHRNRLLKKKRRRKIVWRSIAASIVILLGLNIIFTSKPPQTSELFATYIGEASLSASQGEALPADVFTGIFKGIEQYEMNDYAAAILSFEKLDSWKNDYPEISLFKGIIHLEIGENHIALSAFEACAEHRGPYRKYARWFRNLAYIRLLDPDAAALFIIERTDWFHTLDESLQKMIRVANLINTGRFKEYRQLIKPGAEGPLILLREDIRAIILYFIFGFIIPIILLRDISRHRFKNRKKGMMYAIVICLPVLGPTAYLILRKRLRVKRNKRK